jgi:CRP-like cAMP-binding protein
MMMTLQKAKQIARNYRKQNDHARALLIYERILATVPLANEIRLRIADLFLEMHAESAAIGLYRAVAFHTLQSGHPLLALSAIRTLKNLQSPIEDVEALLVSNYSLGSPHLARFAIKPAPVSPSTLLEIPELSQSVSVESAAIQAGRLAMDFSVFVRYQEQFHPIPFLSELGPESLLAVTHSLRTLQVDDKETVVNQGALGDSLFLVASGELKVFTTSPQGENKDIARVFENTLLGEMALITGQPRMASVVAVGEADVIEVRKETLEQAIHEVPAVRESLDRFSRERLIKNLMQTSPIFSLFDKSQQSVLLRSFEGHEVDAGTEIIREGERGRGLYLIAAGRCDVFSQASGYPVCLASLGVGELFGEMSVVTDQPTTATVRAMTRTTLLFLARVYVERLGQEIPQIQSYFEQLAVTRARDNSMRLMCGPLPHEVVEVDMSDVISV